MKATASPVLFAIILSATICYANAADSSSGSMWGWITSIWVKKDTIKSLTLNATLSCIPGQVFRYDHNVCFCNDEGTKMTCKRKMYSTLTPELHRIQLQNITTDCSPGEIFKKPCKECLCHTSGKSASCLHDYCPKNETKDTRDKCTPGSVFHDRCNGCICGSNGTAACTNLGCGLERWKDNSTKCVPGSSLMMGCNDCSCDKKGISLTCDKMGCEPMSFYHENILNVTMKCTPNDIFGYNCHQCVCDKNGTFAMCSGKQCPHKYDFVGVKDTVGECHPGMIFADNCNVCICDENRKGVCTTFSCNMSYDFMYVDDLNFARPETPLVIVERPFEDRQDIIFADRVLNVIRNNVYCISYRKSLYAYN